MNSYDPDMELKVFLAVAKSLANPRWRCVKDSLPEPSKAGEPTPKYLVYIGDPPVGEIAIAEWAGDRDMGVSGFLIGGGCRADGSLTHWLPMPTPPAEKKKTERTKTAGGTDWDYIVRRLIEKGIIGVRRENGNYERESNQ